MKAVQDQYRKLLERVIMWRARLDTLPRPAEISEDEAVEAAASYSQARLELFGALERIDVQVRARFDEGEIERGFQELALLYREWQPGDLDETAAGEDGSDAALAGRPESFAPSPEEVLTREPGSSAEI